VNDEPFVKRLREQYLDPAQGIGIDAGCPPVETALRLVLGELKPAEARRFADHAGQCPACASAWRFARVYADEAQLATRTPERATRRRSMAVAGLAVAAALAAFAVWLPRNPGLEIEPVLRSPDRSLVQPLIEDGASLPVDRFVLSWRAATEEARYDIRVTDASLRDIAGEISLTEPEYRVSADALSGLAEGDLILWQVDVVLPDGSRSTSSTFSVRLERP
jgi:hypothetical protein